MSESDSSPLPPKPFTSFPFLAVRAEKPLRRFRLVAELLEGGCCSLRKIAKKLSTHPDGFAISTLCQIPNAPEFVALLRASFGRDICLYQNGQDGLPVMGLSEDGREALRLTVAFLNELDQQGR